MIKVWKAIVARAIFLPPLTWLAEIGWRLRCAQADTIWASFEARSPDD